MISVSASSCLILLMVALGASSIVIDSSATKPPLVFTKWPPPPQNTKSQSLRNQIFHQLRTSGRIPQNMYMKRYPMQMTYMMRPMKYPLLKKTPLVPAPSYYKPTISTPTRYRFQGSQTAPNTGEYVYENPFNNLGYQPNKKKVSLTDDTKYNPIHTVAAPNLNNFNHMNNLNHLNKNLAYSTHTEYIPEPIDNQIFDQKDPQFNQITFRPLSIPQYQVTEQISDQTVRVDPLTGKPKVYSNDLAQPSYKISQSFDSYNQINPANSRPLPIEISFLPQAPSPAQSNTAPIAAPYVQLANQVAQQQLPDTYALPIGNQPQLQQHLMQQQAMLQNVPVSVYNPTYLVTQSNNLLKQHREQLFKPAPAYLGTINQQTIDLSPGNSQPLQDVNSVASPGQLLTSSQSQQKQQQIQHPNAIPLRSDFGAPLAQTDNSPTFQRYVADRPGGNGIIVSQPVLSESELNNLLNIGKQEEDVHNQFIASTFYQAQPDPQVEIDNRQRQHINDITISHANEEIIHGKGNSAELPANLKGRKQTAHQHHQEKLAEQFSAERQPLHIVVADEDYQKKNEVRRSDFFRPEIKSDYMLSQDDARRDDQYLTEENFDTTTDDIDGDDYLAHDIESVDRLALDGETRDPSNINSSTVDSYNY